MEKDKKQVVVASIILVILVIMMLAVIITVVLNKQKLNSLDSPSSDIVDASSKYVTINDYHYDGSDSFSNFKVQKVEFQNLDNNIVKDFLNHQQEFISSIDTYHSELFSSPTKDDAENNISGIVTLISHDNLLSVIYKYQVELPTLNITKDGTFTFNLDATTKTSVDNATLFNQNSKVPNDIASEIYASVISGLDFTKNTYLDFDSGKRVTKDTINDLKTTYIKKIEDYLNTVPAYMDNGSIMIVYKDSDILKLLFKGENITETEDITYIA